MRWKDNPENGRKYCKLSHWQVSPGAQLVKNLPATQETWVSRLGQEDPWRRKWQPIPVLLPRKFHGRRSLVGYSPQGSQRVGNDWATSLSFWLIMYQYWFMLSVGCSVMSNSLWSCGRDRQTPLSMEFSRQEYWSGMPFPSPGILLTQGSNLDLLHWQVDSVLLSH